MSVILVRSTPYAEIIVRRHGKGAELGEPARHVLDVFVQAENLHRHQHDRRVGGTGGFCEIAGHFAIGHLDLRIAHGKAGRVGLDHVGTDGPGGERIAGGDGRGGGHESAAREWGGLCQSDDIGRLQRLGTHRHTPPSMWPRHSECQFWPNANHQPARFASGSGPDRAIGHAMGACEGRHSTEKREPATFDRRSKSKRALKGGGPGGVVRPKRTRPSTQYAANDLASPGYRNWLAPIRRLNSDPDSHGQM